MSGCWCGCISLDHSYAAEVNDPEKPLETLDKISILPKYIALFITTMYPGFGLCRFIPKWLPKWWKVYRGFPCSTFSKFILALSDWKLFEISLKLLECSPSVVVSFASLRSSACSRSFIASVQLNNLLTELRWNLERWRQRKLSLKVKKCLKCI